MVYIHVLNFDSVRYFSIFVHTLRNVSCTVSLASSSLHNSLKECRVVVVTDRIDLEGHIGPASVLDKVALVTLCVIMIGLGMFPSLMTPMVSQGVQHILHLLGGA